MIFMNDFKREPESLITAEITACERVIRSGWSILGNEVTAFESEWARWSGSKYSIGVGNGMDALEIGMRALGISRGDEVITTCMTAFATVLAILRIGATPVLADINPDTAIVDIWSVERCINQRTKAVMVVHLYGQSAPLDAFVDLCSTHSIHLIEDCAQAHGARYNGEHVGTVGAFGGFSFYPTKNLGAVGDAGALNTMSEEIAEAAAKLRNYGQSVRYYHPVVGMNSRLDELQAAILRTRLGNLSEWTKNRRLVAHRYALEICNPSVRVLPLPKDEERHVHHLFVVTVEDRSRFVEHLKQNGVESLIHYPVTVDHQKSCHGIAIDPQGLPRAYKHAETCISIPCHPFLLTDEVSKVIEVVNRYA